MAFKDILVHLDAAPACAARLAYAADMARACGARLTGLYLVDPPMPVFAGTGGAGGMALAGLMEQLREEALAEAGPVEKAFKAALDSHGLEGEWRLMEGPTARVLAEHGRYADLIILGQTDPDAPRPGGDAVIEAGLLETGRPVLVLPYAGSPSFATGQALIGWNASAQASRAVHDALPLLARMKKVTVLVVKPEIGADAHGEEPGADIARHLARHGLPVVVQRVEGADVSAGDVLLNEAAETGADLIVMGGYGHSRIREFILGGATRTILKQMTAPVLMAN